MGEGVADTDDFLMGCDLIPTWRATGPGLVGASKRATDAEVSEDAGTGGGPARCPCC